MARWSVFARGAGFSSLLLAGCAGQVTPIASDVDVTGMPNSELALQRSMDRADAAMRDLGGRTVSVRAFSAAAAATIVPAELQRPETFAWSGPIDIGAKTLADKVGYRLIVTQTIAGPSQPILVSVNMANARIVDAFEALGTAAGPRATVIVDPDRHTVEVQHHV